MTAEAIGWGLLALHSALWFGRWTWVWRRHLRAIPRLMRPGREPLPSLAVFVPARNEERGIERALRSLLGQDYPGLRIVVANDHSTDGTGAILRRLAAEFPERLTVIVPPALPPGWMGKCHALHHAVRALPGPPAEWMLFTDADVIHGRDTLRRAVRHAVRSRADLLTIMPRLDCFSLWDNAVLPVLMHLGTLMVNPAHLNNPRRREIIGIGAFTLARRSTYEAWGGHAAIRAEVIDDMAMGLMTKRHGGRLALVRDRRAVHLRMYPNLAEMMRGFEKNMYTGVGNHPGRAVAAMVALLAIHWTPLGVALWGAAAGLPVLAMAGLAVAVLTGAVLASRVAPLWRTEPVLVALGYPLGALVAAVILSRSLLNGGLRGRVSWRGRTVALEEQQTKQAFG